jgi:hypothetical protein
LWKDLLCKQSETKTTTRSILKRRRSCRLTFEKLPTRTFVKDVLDRFRGHIKKHWSEENIDTIEDDHKELLNAATNDDAIKKILEGHDERVFFNDAWDAMTSKMADGAIRLAKLRQFCGGLATAFPNTCAVESDFSVVKYDQDNRRTDLETFFGCYHSFKAVRFTLQALLSIPAAPLHV